MRPCLISLRPLSYSPTSDAQTTLPQLHRPRLHSSPLISASNITQAKAKGPKAAGITMPCFTTNDEVDLFYLDEGPRDGPPLILIHGWTGSSAAWKRNVPGLSNAHRLIVPDLRGHGQSDKPVAGHHVARLAMDLRELLDHLGLPHGSIKAVGASLGCAIIWSYAELFTTSTFSHVVLVDQSPIPKYSSDGRWGVEYGNKGLNSAESLANLLATLNLNPDLVYRDTANSCLAYLSHPLPTDTATAEEAAKSKAFFVDIARQGNAKWFGQLMADHASLDWLASIQGTFGGDGPSKTRVLVVASNRSGCFYAKGPLLAVICVNSESPSRRADQDGEEAPQEARAEGVIVDWGGHWCYWEEPEKFNALVLQFLEKPAPKRLGPLPRKERPGRLTQDTGRVRAMEETLAKLRSS